MVTDIHLNKNYDCDKWCFTQFLFFIVHLICVRKWFLSLPSHYSIKFNHKRKCNILDKLQTIFIFTQKTEEFFFSAPSCLKSHKTSINWKTRGKPRKVDFRVQQVSKKLKRKFYGCITNVHVPHKTGWLCVEVN